MNAFVYIVRCSDDFLYTGVTKNLKNRIWQHNNSRYGARSLRGKRPVVLVYKERFLTISDALKREKEIKGWRKEKKLELINNMRLR